jgi:hypothetical protein
LKISHKQQSKYDSIERYRRSGLRGKNFLRENAKGAEKLAANFDPHGGSPARQF